MSEISKIKLETSCILNVPIKMYPNDFLFIVNGKEFRTNTFASDLLSPTICNIHSADPTVNVFQIDTKYQGDFSKILKLINFEQIEYQDVELMFILEIFEILGLNPSNFNIQRQNIVKKQKDFFAEMQIHEKFPKFYHQLFEEDIEFISSHFYELCETYEDKLMNLNIDTLYRIINSRYLKLENEDQLIKFVNKVYQQNSMYSILYEYVYFDNVSANLISEFLEIYDFNDMNSSVWQNLSKRLKQDTVKNYSINLNERYKKSDLKKKIFTPNKKDELCGIINHIQKQSSAKIQNKINFTASSMESKSDEFQPNAIGRYEDKCYYFVSNDVENSWICIDFNKYKIIPTHYTLKSADWNPNGPHPKSWIIEVSNDKNLWEVIDERKNCPDVNGYRKMSTFEIQKKVENNFRFIRYKQTGKNWRGDNKIIFESMEIYGTLLYYGEL